MRSVAIFSELSIVRDSPPSLVFSRDSKTDREWKSFIVQKGEGLIEDCWPEEAGGRLTRSRASHMTGLGSIFDFLWLVLHWKQGLNIGNLVVIVQVLNHSGLLLQGLRFGFLDWLLQTCGSEFYGHIYCLTLLHTHSLTCQSFGLVAIWIRPKNGW